MSDMQGLIDQVQALVQRIEAVLPQPLRAPDWSAAVAWRYRRRASGHGVLAPVSHLSTLTLDDLKEPTSRTQTPTVLGSTYPRSRPSRLTPCLLAPT